MNWTQDPLVLAVAGLGTLVPSDVAVTAPIQNRYIIINSGRAPGNDLQLRKTIIHAINKVGIIDAEMAGLADPVDQLFRLAACTPPGLARHGLPLETY